MVYSVAFQRFAETKTGELKSGEIVLIRMAIIRESTVHYLYPKNVFSWDKEYKCIYVGFFPDNPAGDYAHFFPMKQYISISLP